MSRDMTPLHYFLENKSADRPRATFGVTCAYCGRGITDGVHVLRGDESDTVVARAKGGAVMTYAGRKEIMAEFRTAKRGDETIIVSPGKFEGEPIYAPWFYASLLDGMADHDDDGVASFLIDDGDRREFPELRGHDRVYLEESDNGFLHVWAV